MKLLEPLQTALAQRQAAAQASLLKRAQPLLDRYSDLAPREQVMVGIGIVFVALFLAYSLLWAPFALANRHQTEALNSAKALAQRLETLALLQQNGQNVVGVQGQGQSLLTLVDTAARESSLGKAPTRLQPEGEKEVKIWFEDIAFDALARWTAQLESRYGITVNSAEMERRPITGTVNARLSLVRKS